jgi:uncharacterized protein YndB with AHSA1/START domain
MTEDTRRAGGRTVLSGERYLNHAPETVWPALVEPARLGQWYPFRVMRLDLLVGGRIDFDDCEGTIYKGEVVERNEIGWNKCLSDLESLLRAD